MALQGRRITYKVDHGSETTAATPAGKGKTPAKAKGKAKGNGKGKEPAEQAEAEAATQPPNPDKLWLLPGSPHLLRHEHNMSVNEHSPISVPYFAAFRRLIHLISEKEEDKGAEPFEYVIVDFGPSCTLLNKTFIMSCDYILPPVFCDSFSFESVHGFLNELLPDTRDESGMLVPGWLSWAKGRRMMLAPDASEHHRFNPAPPRILPFLITAFKVRGCNSKGVKAMALQKQYALWAATITHYVGQTEAGPVRDCFILPNTSETNTEMASCFLANLNSTMPVSHGIRIPLGPRHLLPQVALCRRWISCHLRHPLLRRLLLLRYPLVRCLLLRHLLTRRLLACRRSPLCRLPLRRLLARCLLLHPGCSTRYTRLLSLLRRCRLQTRWNWLVVLQDR